MLAALLGVIGAAALAIDISTDLAAAWTPNIATSAWSIALALAVVERIVKQQARGRIVQALRRIDRALGILANKLVWDYFDMHEKTYNRPPTELGSLLLHWKDGLATIDAPWSRSPRTLGAAEVVVKYLNEQIDRHGTVLDHSLIEAAFQFRASVEHARSYLLVGGDNEVEARVEQATGHPVERIGKFDHPFGEEEDLFFLRRLIDDAIRFLDVYEPYRQRFLDTTLAVDPKWIETVEEAPRGSTLLGYVVDFDPDSRD